MGSPFPTVVFLFLPRHQIRELWDLGLEGVRNFPSLTVEELQSTELPAVQAGTWGPDSQASTLSTSDRVTPDDSSLTQMTQGKGIK